MPAQEESILALKSHEMPLIRALRGLGFISLIITVLRGLPEHEKSYSLKTVSAHFGVPQMIEMASLPSPPLVSSKVGKANVVDILLCNYLVQAPLGSNLN